MKLAEALKLRADTQSRISQLQTRLSNNSTVQEGETPAEDPVQLLDELEKCFARLEELINAINRTNCATQTPMGTLTLLLARRDCMKCRIDTYHRFLTEASSIARRATHSEIKIFPTVSVREYRKKCDDFARELRELDALIQATNWTSELL